MNVQTLPTGRGGGATHLPAAFADEKAAQLNYIQDEESGEWQANMFADYFLVPDHVAIKLGEPDLIAGLCVVADDVAARRTREAASAKSVLTPPYEGEMCGECCNFTLLRNGTSLKCDTCGSTAGFHDGRILTAEKQ
jgi:hypothetical protein